MTRIQLILSLAVASLSACTDVQPGDEATDTDTSALSAAEVTHAYYSDATFTHEVGEVVLSPGCGPGKSQWGNTHTHFYVVDSVPCNTGSRHVSCYEFRGYGDDGDFYEVECPSSVF